MLALQAASFAYKHRAAFGKAAKGAGIVGRGVALAQVVKSAIKKKVRKRSKNVPYLTLGLPLRVKGMLKTSQVSAALDTPTGKFYFAMLNLVDMNNDKRSAAGAAVTQGTSHVVTAATPAVALLRAPFYFNEIAVHYAHYLIRRVSFVMTIANNDTTAGDDMTIGWKLMHSHEDTDNELRDVATVEVLRAVKGMRYIHLNPVAATRTGNKVRRTIRGSYNVFKLVPKRVYFSESSETAVGEKTFASTTAITAADTAIGPRVLFWAWKTFSQAHIDADALSMEWSVTYHYTAYDKDLPTVS